MIHRIEPKEEVTAQKLLETMAFAITNLEIEVMKLQKRVKKLEKK